MTEELLQKAVYQRVQVCLALAGRYFNKEFHYDELCFSLRGRSAGQFVASNKTIKGQYLKLRFNNALLCRYGDVFIDEVVTHESAHLVVFQHYGTYENGRRVLPHGKQWKYVMRNVFNAEPKVRHQFDIVQEKTKKSYSYICQCDERVHLLSIVRHNKVLRRKANYQCLDCRGLLRVYRDRKMT